MLLWPRLIAAAGVLQQHVQIVKEKKEKKEKTSIAARCGSEDDRLDGAPETFCFLQRGLQTCPPVGLYIVRGNINNFLQVSATFQAFIGWLRVTDSSPPSTSLCLPL